MKKLSRPILLLTAIGTTGLLAMAMPSPVNSQTSAGCGCWDSSNPFGTLNAFSECDVAVQYYYGGYPLHPELEVLHSQNDANTYCPTVPACNPGEKVVLCLAVNRSY